MSGLISSKKFQVMIVAVLTVLFGRVGLNIPEETLMQITGIVMAWLGAQGLADFQKNRGRDELTPKQGP